MHILAETSRNSPKRPKHTEILPEVEWGVVSYQFAYGYESDRNGMEYTTMLETSIFKVKWSILIEQKSKRPNSYLLVLSPPLCIFIRET